MGFIISPCSAAAILVAGEAPAGLSVGAGYPCVCQDLSRVLVLLVWGLEVQWGFPPFDRRRHVALAGPSRPAKAR